MLFALFIISSLYVSTVNCWGPIGHPLVASIAQSMLTSDSQKFVRDHLPWYTTGNLSMLSSWPDTILYPESNPVDYLNWQWSKELHYVNTPDWVCNYNRTRDCNWTNAQNCVDGAIHNYTVRLADPKQNDVQRQEALKFLVHFIGDSHQPLHAGFASDRGGNSINGTFFGKKTNLHKVWDTLIIERRILDYGGIDPYYEYLTGLIHTMYAGNISGWTTCSPADESRYLACSTDWLSENSALNCDRVYIDEQGNRMNASGSFHLDEVYYDTRKATVDERLIQAGVRLAAVINKIVALQKHHHRDDDDDDDDDELCSGTILLFVFIFVEILIAFFVLTYYLARRTLNQRSSVEKLPTYESFEDIKK